METVHDGPAITRETLLTGRAQSERGTRTVLEGRSIVTGVPDLGIGGGDGDGDGVGDTEVRRHRSRFVGDPSFSHPTDPRAPEK